jgi:membrane carboxypeptidase/penicillin-binding protein
VGLTPEVAVAVWVGRDEGTLGLAGSRAALPTWARFVAATGTLGTTPPRPDGLVEVALCAESGMPARDACPLTYTDLFVEGKVPEAKCDVHGGPVVKAGRLFGDLFRKKEDPEQPEPVVE